MTENDNGQVKDPRDQSGTAADPPDAQEQQAADSAPEPEGKEGMNIAPGPAEEKDRETPDDRGLTTDTSPSD